MPEAQVLDVQEFDYENEVLAREEEEAYRRYLYNELQKAKKEFRNPEANFTTMEEMFDRIYKRIEERKKHNSAFA